MIYDTQLQATYCRLAPSWTGCRELAQAAMRPGHSRTAVLPARLRYWSIATQDRDESETPSESAILQAGHEGKELITHAPKDAKQAFAV
jgi:hypothetical protein